MISIVIPTLNEESVLQSTLAGINRPDAAHELIISDGGSTDATATIAHRHPCHFFRCPAPGRAAQLNAGASRARGDALLFLHADTRLSPDCLPVLAEVLRARPEIVGGAFSRRFQCDSRLLAWTCRLADWRGRLLGLFFGDQAIFVRREVFETIGGFRALPLFEDMDFSRRMKAAGPVVLLKPRVLSSARRFAQRGPMAVTLSDFWLTCRYLAGAEPGRLTGRPPR